MKASDRLLAVLPSDRPCTLRWAGHRAGLSDVITYQAAAELLREGTLSLAGAPDGAPLRPSTLVRGPLAAELLQFERTRQRLAKLGGAVAVSRSVPAE